MRPAHDSDPRFITHAEERASDPLSVYAQTYSAISDTEDARPSRRTRRIGAGTILVVLALGGTAALLSLGRVRLPSLPLFASDEPPRALPAVRNAYAPEVIGTTLTGPKTTLRVGEERQFAIADGPDLRYGRASRAPGGEGRTSGRSDNFPRLSLLQPKASERFRSANGPPGARRTDGGGDGDVQPG